MLEAIVKALDIDGQQCVSSIAEAAVDLNAPSAHVFDVALTLTELTTQQFEISQQISTAEYQLAALKQEKRRLSITLAELRSETLQPDDTVSANMAEWQRNSKHLGAKLGEYNERLASIKTTIPEKPAMRILREQHEGNAQLRNELETLKSQIQAYQDLPSTTRNARKIIEHARDDLQALLARRDGLFEQLAKK